MSEKMDLQTKEDFILYLRDIIELTARYIKRLSRYKLELKQLITNNKNDEKKLKMEIYEEFLDKTRHVQIVLANIIGDKSSNAISYNKFKEHIKKKTEIEQYEMTKDTEDLLFYFMEIRNFVSHISNAYFLTYKEMNQEEKEVLIYNPIQVLNHHYQHEENFIFLQDNLDDFYDKSRKVHQQMKKDYSKLIGENVKLEYIKKDLIELDFHKNLNAKAYDKKRRKRK